jgi:hypothetical protein
MLITFLIVLLFVVTGCTVYVYFTKRHQPSQQLPVEERIIALNDSCMICNEESARQYSSMCQDCIDKGWRWSGYPDGHYYQEKPIVKLKSIRVTRRRYDA